jgi:hypothetical protein
VRGDRRKGERGKKKWERGRGERKREGGRERE